MSKSKNKLIISILAILVLIYVAGGIYFGEYSFPKTTVNGDDRSLMKKSEVLVPSNEGYKLLVKGRDDKSTEIAPKDIDFQTTVVGKPELNQNNWLWPIEIFKSHEYNIEVKNTFNATKLDTLLDKSELFTNVVEPQDADIEKTEEKYIIKEEVMGNKLDKEKLVKSIEKAIENNEEEITLEDEYIKPTVFKDDKELNETIEKMNALYAKNYVFDFVDRKWELKGDELLGMFDHTDNKYVLNRDGLYEYVRQLAIETDTYNTSRSFQATGIGEVTVPGGIYGWQMDVGETVNTVADMIDKNEDGEVEISYLMEALHRETNDIGNTYVEIDLSRQHMWFYKDGELFIDTPVVTGDARSYGATTPTGVNKIWSKEEGKTLVGNNAISGASYSVPVSYWMPIGWTGSGIHDSTRSSFGGDIYRSYGSSSCINTPPDVMRTIFNNVPINTAVVVYESSTNYSPTEFEKQEMIRKGDAKADVQ